MLVKITWNNQGGPLDSVVIEWNENAAETPIADALSEMLGGVDLQPGDTVTIREV